MMLLNIDYVPGKEIEAIGMVKGAIVQTKHFGNDFMAGMKTLVGGEITSYTDMLNKRARSRRSHWHPLQLRTDDAGRCGSTRIRNRSQIPLILKCMPTMLACILL